MQRQRNMGIVAAFAVVLVLGGPEPLRWRAPQASEGPRFEVDPLWPKPLPNHWLLGSVVGVAVDERDHVFVLHLVDSFNQRNEIGAATQPPTGECCRPAPSVLEFDARGNLVGYWGGPSPQYDWPEVANGLALDPAGNLWIGGGGGGDTRLLKFTRDGHFLGYVGASVKLPLALPDSTADVAGRSGRGGRGGRGASARPAVPPDSRSLERFGGPADIAFDASGRRAFVADGFRNRRIAVVDVSTGRIERYWGGYGEPPSDSEAAGGGRQFGTPLRCVAVSLDDLVYVCDPAHNRIQVFRVDGSFVGEVQIMPQTRGGGSVWDIAFSRDRDQRFLFVADGMNKRIHVLERGSMTPITSFGGGGRQPGQFVMPHSLAVDSHGNLYAVEAGEGKRVQRFVFKGIGEVPRDQGVVWPRRQRGEP
jgi:hypothetical protein